MLIPGHIATGFLFAEAYTQRRYHHVVAFRLALAAGFGGLLPDLIDKPMYWLGYFVYGRSVGHSIFFLAPVFLSALLIRQQRVYRPYVVAAIAGALTHLFADFAADIELGLRFTGVIFSGWFLWPISTPDDHQITVYASRHSYALRLSWLEAITCATAALIALRSLPTWWRARKNPSESPASETE